MLLEVKNLKTSFFTKLGEVESVRDVSFEIDKNEILGVVGESGSGKSITSKSIMKLIEKPGKILDGEIIFEDKNLINLSEKEMRTIRGKEIAMIFQDPMTSLNPLVKISKQMSEIIVRHKKISKKQARQESIEMLRLVGIPNPETRIDSYPHEFSGGMRQRVCIAMAMSLSPKLLIADEITTALDVTIQSQILNLIKQLNKKDKNSTILITHDLNVVEKICDRVMVMYGGMIMESASIDEIFKNPKHPYTRGLLNSIPDKDNKVKKRLTPIQGTPPNLLNPPKGCPFYDRCQVSKPICNEMKPQTKEISNTHKVNCFNLDEVK